MFPEWYGVLKEHLIHEIRRKGGVCRPETLLFLRHPNLSDTFISARLLNFTQGSVLFFLNFLLIGVTNGGNKWGVLITRKEKGDPKNVESDEAKNWTNVEKNLLLLLGLGDTGVFSKLDGILVRAKKYGQGCFYGFSAADYQR